MMANSSRTVRMALIPLTAAWMMACTQGKNETEKTTETKAAVKDVPSEAEISASTPECVGPIKDGEAITHKIAGMEWVQTGSTLKLASAPKGKKLVIGAISDIKENSPENLKNLETFMAWFKEKKVDMVMVTGDTGLDQAQLEGSLAAIAGIGVPVFNIVGNREGRQDYKNAMANTHKKFPNVFDLTQIRRIDTPELDIISMPGYYDASFIHAEDGGCPYFQDDVKALAELAKTADSPVMLISHGGPKQSTAEGIDATQEGDNVGDPMLTKLIAEQKIPFGIFGNIHEAGGRATDAAGMMVLEQGKPSDSMLLNPGPADAVGWKMNDKTESVGMAALVTVSGGKASYEIKRVKAEAPKTASKK